MASRMNWHAELNALRKEIEALRQGGGGGASAPEASDSHLRDLQQLAQSMLDEAEETISEHPVATVAGALALGIVIGRLTAR